LDVVDAAGSEVTAMDETRVKNKCGCWNIGGKQ
jgi:hypothetical protein